MDIMKFIKAQRECLTRELRSYTFKSSADHWLWRESEPDKDGESYVHVFDTENDKPMRLTVRMIHSCLANDYERFDSETVIKSQCGDINCVNPDHNAIVLSLTDRSYAHSKDDWTLPFGWKI